jgi:hypothetical protein
MPPRLRLAPRPSQFLDWPDPLLLPFKVPTGQVVEQLEGIAFDRTFHARGRKNARGRDRFVQL